MRAPVALFLLLLGGCAGAAPPAGPVGTQLLTRMQGIPPELAGLGARPSDHRVPTAPDAAWGALPGAFRGLGIEANSVDPAARTFAAVGVTPRQLAGEPLSRFLECGNGAGGVPMADSHALTLYVFTTLAPDGAGTRVRTAVAATGRARGGIGEAVNCGSNGRLEGRIARALRDAGAG